MILKFKSWTEVHFHNLNTERCGKIYIQNVGWPCVVGYDFNFLLYIFLDCLNFFFLL